MKEVTIETIIEQLDNDNLFIYLGADVNIQNVSKKPIVLFTQDLSRTGAPSTLLEFSKILKEREYDIFVVSDRDGDLINDFVQSGINVICYPQYARDYKWLEIVTRIFDTLLVNTFVLVGVVTMLAPIAKKLYWWIHEGENFFKYEYELLKGVPRVPSLCMLAASPMVKRLIKEYMNIDAELLELYIKDEKCTVIEKKDSIKIMHVGAVDGNKGQRVIIDALKKMDNKYMDRINVYFCGIHEYYKEEELQYLAEYEYENDNVYIYEAMPKEELYKMYDVMDIVVVASYVETTSAVAIEGMMKEKLCIVSDGCGVCEYMTDKKDGLIFKKGDSEQLSELLIYAIDNYCALDGIRSNGRKLYEEHYSKDKFESRVIEIFEKSYEINDAMNMCSGCGACYLSCNMNAITMNVNEKGFLYPEIDHNKCVQCGKCKNVCPVNSPLEETEIKEYYAFRYRDEEKLMQSQSGGAFSSLAEKVLSENGIIYGVGIDDNNVVKYMRIDKKEELIKLKGSKYVQAKLVDTYREIAKDIRERKVLFAGTPCYVAGLKRYLASEKTDNLITCDLICHGVPSPGVFGRHIEYLVNTKGNISNFTFRNKAVNGWRIPVETYIDNEGEQIIKRDYSNIFYSDACLRDSCYVCKYSNLDREGDLTLGDFWGIENVFPDMDDNKGVSVVFVNTHKGKELFADVIATDNVEIRKTDIKLSMQRNMFAPTPRPKIVEEFWRDYLNMEYRELLRKYGSPHKNRPEISVINMWQKMLDEKKNISSVLIKNNTSKVAVCGNIKYNSLLIKQLKIEKIDVCAEIKIKDEVTGVVPAYDANDNLSWLESVIDTIIVTDENNMSDILMKLHEAGISMDKITPLSFLVDEEV